MARTFHRTPRHLDDPLRLGAFTLAQWAILIVAIALAWGVLSQLVFVPAMWRFVLGGLCVGGGFGFTEAGYGGSVTELPRRTWHALTAPREYVSGPPRRGPLAAVLLDERAAGEELPHA
jgi:hypothetical protein